MQTASGKSTLAERFSGSVPGTSAPYQARYWSHPNGTFTLDVEVPGRIPVMAFQPREFNNSHGMVQVYPAPSPTTGMLGLNVAVGPGVRVTIQRPRISTSNASAAAQTSSKAPAPQQGEPAAPSQRPTERDSVKLSEGVAGSIGSTDDKNAPSHSSLRREGIGYDSGSHGSQGQPTPSADVTGQAIIEGGTIQRTTKRVRFDDSVQAPAGGSAQPASQSSSRRNSHAEADEKAQ